MYFVLCDEQEGMWTSILVQLPLIFIGIFYQAYLYLFGHLALFISNLMVGVAMKKHKTQSLPTYYFFNLCGFVLLVFHLAYYGQIFSNNQYLLMYFSKYGVEKFQSLGDGIFIGPSNGTWGNLFLPLFMQVLLLEPIITCLSLSYTFIEWLWRKKPRNM